MTNQFTKINHQFVPVPANQILDCYSCNPYVYSGKNGSDASDCGVYILNTAKQQFIVLREFERIGRKQFLIDIPIGLDNLIPHLLAILKVQKIHVSPTVQFLHLVPQRQPAYPGQVVKPDEFKFIVVDGKVDIQPSPFKDKDLVNWFGKQIPPIEVTEELLNYV